MCGRRNGKNDSSPAIGKFRGFFSLRVSRKTARVSDGASVWGCLVAILKPGRSACVWPEVEILSNDLTTEGYACILSVFFPQITNCDILITRNKLYFDGLKLRTAVITSNFFCLKVNNGEGDKT